MESINTTEVVAETDTESEPDGMLAYAIAIDKQEWPQTMDAQVWARKWMEHIAENPGIATDEGTMLGWFANAIMAGYDTATSRIHSANEAG